MAAAACNGVWPASFVALTTIDDVYEKLEAMTTQQAEDTVTILARSDANTQRLADQIDSIKTQVEESLQKALVLILAHRRRDEPTDAGPA